MNFDSLSQYVLSPSSSSSSSDDDFQMLMDHYDLEQRVLRQLIQNNNIVIAWLLRQQNAESRGSVLRRRTNVNDREAAATNLFNDYFSGNPADNEERFRQRYRMSRRLFLRIVDAVKNHDLYFVQRRNAVGKLGLSTLQKVTAAFRILTTTILSNATNEYISIGESTSIECVKRFCRAVREIFAQQYLRSPTVDDVDRLLYIGKQRGLPGMLGSLDCMHWRWNNPEACVGQNVDRRGYSTIILEIVADYDLWIWHAYFGMPGSNSDMNVVETSNLLYDLARGRGVAPPVHYVIGEKEYNMGYYLAGNIYPKYATLVRTIHAPMDPKKMYFAKKQEACKRDVEHAFELLQSRFAIVANPARIWSKSDLEDIMFACIIMHNMIIEDERDLEAPIEEARDVTPPDIEFVGNEYIQFQDFLARFRRIRRADAHFMLRNALIDHLWNECSNSNS